MDAPIDFLDLLVDPDMLAKDFSAYYDNPTVWHSPVVVAEEAAGPAPAPEVAAAPAGGEPHRGSSAALQPQPGPNPLGAGGGEAPPLSPRALVARLAAARHRVAGQVASTLRTTAWLRSQLAMNTMLTTARHHHHHHHRGLVNEAAYDEYEAGAGLGQTQRGYGWPEGCYGGGGGGDSGSSDEDSDDLQQHLSDDDQAAAAAAPFSLPAPRLASVVTSPPLRLGSGGGGVPGCVPRLKLPGSSGGASHSPLPLVKLSRACFQDVHPSTAACAGSSLHASCSPASSISLSRRAGVRPA